MKKIHFKKFESINQTEAEIKFGWSHKYEIYS